MICVDGVLLGDLCIPVGSLRGCNVGMSKNCEHEDYHRKIFRNEPETCKKISTLKMFGIGQKRSFLNAAGL